MYKILFTILFLCFSSSAISEGYPEMEPLTGQWDISGATPVDAPPNESRDTHFRVYLTGEPAKAIYIRMNSKPRELCGGEGTLSKYQGSMSCTLTKKNSTYECWFAIDINKQEISGGFAC